MLVGANSSYAHWRHAPRTGNPMRGFWQQGSQLVIVVKPLPVD